MTKPHRQLHLHGSSMSAPISPAVNEKRLARHPNYKAIREWQIMLATGVAMRDATLPSRPEALFDVRNSGDDEWGNVFLTHNWTLYVDWTKQQHDAAMERLGIWNVDVIVSGSIRTVGGRTSVQFRCGPGTDRGEISELQARQFERAIVRLLDGEE